MRISNEDSTRRREAVLQFFRQNPDASAAKANEALKSGQLTGKKEGMLNIKTAYQLRTEARKTIATSKRPVSIPESEFRAQKQMEATSSAVPFSSAGLSALKTVQGEMAKMPDNLLSLNIHRSGRVTVNELTEQEREVTGLSSAKA